MPIRKQIPKVNFSESVILSRRRPDVKWIWERPFLYEKQARAIFSDARYSWIEASTKSGKTHGCLIWILEQAMRAAPGANCWWIAPYYGQALVAYKRMKRGLPSTIFSANDTAHTITLMNDVTISFKSGENPDALYGDDVHAAVLDEASRMREESFFAIRSTLTATCGPMRLIGNVKGRGNFFYRGARAAQAGRAGHEYHRITSADAIEAGILDADEIADAKLVLPENIFDELYNCIPSDDGGNPFGIKFIAQCLSPMSGSDPVIWGWDLAKKMDWSVGIALDSKGRVCRFERFQKPWLQTICDIRNMVGKCRAIVDSTGVGDAILESLQAGPKYSDSRDAKPKYEAGPFEGYQFTSQSKQRLMERLSVAIQSGQVHFPAGMIEDELKIFEFEYTRTGVKYSAPQGLHDDIVCALAMAWYGFSGPQETEFYFS